jgi:predicted Zn-ribbon and HTH transcriptional regulator
MSENSKWIVVRRYSVPLDAEMACSALRAAGIHATLADEHIVSANWLWSNAVGGVKVLVAARDTAAARTVLETPARVDTDALPDGGGILAVEPTECPRCGSEDVERVSPGRRLAFLSWLLVGAPVVPVLRRTKCRACGHRFRVPRETA